MESGLTGQLGDIKAILVDGRDVRLADLQPDPASISQPQVVWDPTIAYLSPSRPVPEVPR